MKCLINVKGGLGKNVMLTALLPIIKEQCGYDEIYVVSPYVDVFKACSVVTDVFEPGPRCAPIGLEIAENPDEWRILFGEPYEHEGFIKKQCHLLEAWWNTFGLPSDVDYEWKNLIPVMDTADAVYAPLKRAMEEKAKELGKFIIVQFCGGQSPLAPMQTQDGKPTPYNDCQEGIKRNFYQGQQLINELKKKYPDYKIVHYSLPNEPSYEGAEKLNLPYVAYRFLAAYAKFIVCTDSSLQHLVTGVNDNVFVLWGETRPEHFGYACNHNLGITQVKHGQPYFSVFGMSSAFIKMPTVEEIMSVLPEKE